MCDPSEFGGQSLARAAQSEQERGQHKGFSETISKLDIHLRCVLNSYAEVIHEINVSKGFWDGACNNAEKIALMHSELSEALEADRKNLPSDKIPDFTGLEEELADCIIRILDFAGYHKLELAKAITAKLRYNLTRPYKHGKNY